MCRDLQETRSHLLTKPRVTTPADTFFKKKALRRRRTSVPSRSASPPRVGLSSGFERAFINYVAHTMSTAFIFLLVWGGGAGGIASLAWIVASTGP